MPSIVGAKRAYSAISTTGAATATRQYKDGYAYGTVTNPTSVSRAVTWYGVYSSTRTTAYAVVDEDAVAATQTVAALSMAAIHPALAGVPIACCVTAAAASTVALHFAWYR
jgi:hypothetical protein